MTMYDVNVIGGSYAGMAAALQLARARRRVLVIDSDTRRNRFAETSHGLLGQDGRSPSEMANEAKAQLLKYPTVTWLDGEAESAEQCPDGFTVSTRDKQSSARRLILATGINDQLPEIPGLQERWGKSVFHCPYCHGYELDQGKIGVIATGPASMHQALLIPDWGPTTFLTNNCFTPDATQQNHLAARSVTLETTAITKVNDHASIELDDGRVLEFAGLFVASHTRPTGPLAQQLGCELDESTTGFHVKTDEFKQTTTPGVFACGDLARVSGSVTFAISDGVLAGLAAHRSLIFDDLD